MNNWPIQHEISVNSPARADANRRHRPPQNKVIFFGGAAP